MIRCQLKLKRFLNIFFQGKIAIQIQKGDNDSDDDNDYNNEEDDDDGGGDGDNGDSNDNYSYSEDVKIIDILVTTKSGRICRKWRGQYLNY